MTMTPDELQAELSAIVAKLEEVEGLALRLVQLSTALHKAIVGPVPPEKIREDHEAQPSPGTQASQS